MATHLRKMQNLKLKLHSAAALQDWTGPDRLASDSSEIDEHMNERDRREILKQEKKYCIKKEENCLAALFVLSRAGAFLSDKRSHRPVCLGVRA